MDQRFNWTNLRRNGCPRCSTALVPFATEHMLKCGNPTCPFKISEEKMAALGYKMNKEAMDRPEYRGGEEEEELQKHNTAPLCGFCHLHHGEQEACGGFQ